MKRRLTKLTAAGLAVLALTGCTGGVPEEVSEEPPVPKNVETTWTLVVGQPEGSTCWDAAESFAEALSDPGGHAGRYEPGGQIRHARRRHGRRRGGGGSADAPR